MKINEFSTDTRDAFKPSFDVVDDLCVFMRNDPQFYRRSYFPMIGGMAECYEQGGKFNAKKELFPVVDDAMKKYVATYELAKTVGEVFTSEERMAVAKKIWAEEMGEIRKGTYKK